MSVLGQISTAIAAKGEDEAQTGDGLSSSAQLKQQQYSIWWQHRRLLGERSAIQTLDQRQQWAGRGPAVLVPCSWRLWRKWVPRARDKGTRALERSTDAMPSRAADLSSLSRTLISAATRRTSPETAWRPATMGLKREAGQSAVSPALYPGLYVSAEAGDAGGSCKVVAGRRRRREERWAAHSRFLHRQTPDERDDPRERHIAIRGTKYAQAAHRDRPI